MGEVEVHALRGVDLELYPGEFVVLLGASGSGKSTLLNILGGLDAPTAGTVECRGHPLTGAGDEALTRFRREHVGFVFQFYNLIPSLTARENVALVTEIAREPMSPEEALDLVGLRERPDVLLCDEPTGALDSPTGVLVLEALERINRETGALTVVITHNAVIARMADRVIRLSDGRIAGIERNAARAKPRELSW
jgi:putative ABC transport system ATP-binding protein